MLVSGFPAGLQLSEEELLDKLEIFFGKTRNGGGDVETRELLRGGVVLGFAKDAGEGPAPEIGLMEASGLRPQESRAPDARGPPLSLPAVAQYLCQVGDFTVPLGSQKFPLRVSPYLSGAIQKAEVSGKIENRGLGQAPACQILAQERNRVPKPHSPPHCQRLWPPCSSPAPRRLARPQSLTLRSLSPSSGSFFRSRSGRCPGQC